jgi:hypothetical protein
VRRWCAAFPSASKRSSTSCTAAGPRRGRAALGILATLAFYISLSGVWTFIGQIAQQSGIDAQQSGNIFAIATLLGVAGAGSASLIGRRLPRPAAAGRFRHDDGGHAAIAE